MGKIWLKSTDPSKICCGCEGKTGPCDSCCNTPFEYPYINGDPFYGNPSNFLNEVDLINLLKTETTLCNIWIFNRRDNTTYNTLSPQETSFDLNLNDPKKIILTNGLIGPSLGACASLPPEDNDLVCPPTTTNLSLYAGPASFTLSFNFLPISDNNDGTYKYGFSSFEITGSYLDYRIVIQNNYYKSSDTIDLPGCSNISFSNDSFFMRVEILVPNGPFAPSWVGLNKPTPGATATVKFAGEISNTYIDESYSFSSPSAGYLRLGYNVTTNGNIATGFPINTQGTSPRLYIVKNAYQSTEEDVPVPFELGSFYYNNLVNWSSSYDIALPSAGCYSLYINNLVKFERMYTPVIANVQMTFELLNTEKTSYKDVSPATFKLYYNDNGVVKNKDCDESMYT